MPPISLKQPPKAPGASLTKLAASAFSLLFFAAPGLLTANSAPAFAQQQQPQQSDPRWVFVPGSRQAKPAAGASQSGAYPAGAYPNNSYPPGSYPAGQYPGGQPCVQPGTVTTGGMTGRRLRYVDPSQYQTQQTPYQTGTGSGVGSTTGTSTRQPGTNTTYYGSGGSSGASSAQQHSSRQPGYNTTYATGTSPGRYPQTSPGTASAGSGTTYGQPPGIQTRSAATQSTSQSGNQTTSPGARSYDYTDTINVDGVMRKYIVHVPKGYDRQHALPVVMVFHGMGMNGLMMLGLTGFNGLADQKNFVVVYPDAVGGAWADGRSGGGGADIDFVEAMLQKLSATVKVDSHRVYACGISNGGYFSQVLACAMPSKIAAAGVVASSMMAQVGMAQAGSGGQSVPIAFFLGTDDPLLPWADGRTKELGKLGEILGISAIGSIDGPLARMGGVMTVPDTLSFWTNRNGCSGEPRVTQEPDRAPNDGTRVEKCSFGSGGSEVLLYKIQGGGHTWPGCLNLKAISGVSGNISQDIDASELLWDFFSRHSR